jgi:aryl-alcohol dehydrogenase-like predicted oxidoreductase
MDLAGTDITASQLGFGCSALLDEGTKNRGLRLLEVAYDEGITYFDVARMYGDGAAELILGKFARGKRDRVVIASKFGIQPVASMLARHGRMRGAVSKLIRLSPRLRSLLRRRAISTGRFNVNDARKSLEVSLRTLATDYLDIYLLHDCSVTDPSEELLRFLEQARSEGKIRYFGLASGIDEILEIGRRLPQFVGVAQFENSILKRNLDLAADLPGALITHGAMAGSLAALRKSLDCNPELSLQWSSRLGVDLMQTSELANLMLAWAVKANIKGPVLFHSSREDSIRDNVAAVVDNRFSAAQLDEFDRLTAAQDIFITSSNRPRGANLASSQL